MQEVRDFHHWWMLEMFLDLGSQIWNPAKWHSVALSVAQVRNHEFKTKGMTKTQICVLL